MLTLWVVVFKSLRKKRMEIFLLFLLVISTSSLTHIIINFFAPLDLEKPEKTINFNLASFKEDVDLLRISEKQFCIKQCYKMCFYVQKLYMIEILKMRCEFLKDESGSIWFSYAQDIRVRPIAERDNYLIHARKVTFTKPAASEAIV